MGDFSRQQIDWRDRPGTMHSRCLTGAPKRPDDDLPSMVRRSVFPLPRSTNLRLSADDEKLPIRSPILSMQLPGHQPQLHKHLAEDLLLPCRQGLLRITELSVKKTSDEFRQSFGSNGRIGRAA